MLPLADVNALISHDDTILSRVCCWLVVYPARAVAHGAPVCPQPGHLSGRICKANISFARLPGDYGLHSSILIRTRDYCETSISFILTSGIGIRPAGLTFPQNEALLTISIHGVSTRTCCIGGSAIALSLVPLTAWSEVVDVAARLGGTEDGSGCHRNRNW